MRKHWLNLLTAAAVLVFLITVYGIVRGKLDCEARGGLYVHTPGKFVCLVLPPDCRDQESLQPNLLVRSSST